MLSVTDSGMVEIRGKGSVVIAEFSVLVYSLFTDANAPEWLIRQAFEAGINLAKDSGKSEEKNALEKYLAELSSRVLGEPS